MDLSHLYDPNAQRRRLKRIVIELSDSLTLTAEPPHAFDTTRLVHLAHELLDHRMLRTQPTARLDLAEATGAVEALLVDDDAARRTFAAMAAADPSAAPRFDYLTGLYLDMRRGRVEAASRLFEGALERTNGDRGLRSLIQLALARSARESGDFSYAAWAYGEVMMRPARALVPHARQGLASLELVRDQIDEAERLGRVALKEFQAIDDRLGVLTARSHLANVALARGEALTARDELEQVVSARRATCDIMRLPKSLNNLAVVHERLGDWHGSRTALLEAMRLNRDQSRERMLAANFHNLGSCLQKSGEPTAAVAAFDEAMRLARGVGAHDREMLSLVALIDLLGSREPNARTQGVMAGLTARGRDVLRHHPDSLSREAIVGFSLESATAFERGWAGASPVDVGNPAWVPSQGRGRLAALTAFESAPGILDRLRSQVEAALAMRGAPDGRSVSEFLELFLGDYLKNSDYAGEFAVSHHTAKRHLKALCGSGVLALTGTRKAARYSVALLR